MRLQESVRFAWGGIVASRMRSALTMLGIVIGVASVITLVAVGTGSNRAVAASISRLGSNSLYAIPMPTGTGGHGSAFQNRIRKLLGIKSKPDNATHDEQPKLTFADAAALSDPVCCPDVEQESPLVAVHNVVSTLGDASHTTQVLLGAAPNYLSIDNDTISVGRGFNQAAYQSHARVADIGTSVAADLTNGTAAGVVGRQVLFNGQAFTVIGILGSKGYSGQQDLDDRVVAPLTAVQDTLYGYDPPTTGPLSGIAVQARSSAATSAAQAEVQTVLDRRHHVSAADTDVVVFSAASVLAASTKSSHTLTILLGAVAGISLLVGGIGVMNIMLVSVTERTREIGIRKAIGAAKADIIGQFLTEAVIVSLLGGALGVGVGWIAARFEIVGVQPVVAGWSIWLALAVSLMTGLFFGLYPANRAAALRPIDALRYE
jgi:putative ABC transport system permease protein